MSVREDIKVLLAREDWRLSEIAKEMTNITKKNYSGQNLSQKMTRKTLKYEEAKLIGDILGYDLTFIKRQR